MKTNKTNKRVVNVKTTEHGCQYTYIYNVMTRYEGEWGVYMSFFNELEAERMMECYKEGRENAEVFIQRRICFF